MGHARVRGLVMVVLVLGGMALAAYTYATVKGAREMNEGKNTIAVSGKGEEFIKPDIATFSFSVTADEKDATTAQQKSADAVNAITAYLKEQGIEEKDIKTEGYNLSPKYDYTATACPQFSYCPPGKQVLTGYTVDQAISVKVRKIEKAGDLITGVGGKGATNVSGLTFTIDDIDKARERVREEAIKDARDKAGRLAESLGVHLGKLVNYAEDGNQPVMYNAYGGATKSMAMDAAAPAFS